MNTEELLQNGQYSIIECLVLESVQDWCQELEHEDGLSVFIVQRLPLPVLSMSNVSAVSPTDHPSSCSKIGRAHV